MDDNTMLLMMAIVMLFFFTMVSGKGRINTNKLNTEYIPYSKKNILTKNEHEFYMMLRTLPILSNCIILTKVDLKAFLNVHVSDRRYHKRYFNMISQKHVDFIVCDNELNIYFTIELDDSSHLKSSSGQGDDFKDEVFEKIGIKLVRIKALKNGSYTSEYIGEHLEFFKKSIG